MLFLPPEDVPLNLPILKFYCGTTCSYFPLLIVFLLGSELIYQVGKLSFLFIVGLLFIIELGKYCIVCTNFKEHDKYPTRHCNKVIGAASRKVFSEKRIKDIVKGFLVVCLFTVFYYSIAILFGAEILSNFEETLMFSGLLSILTALPPCLYMGPNHALGAFLGEKGAPSSPLSPILQHVVRVTLFGAWLGAFVIPLDWDRPWQKWPVPCTVGALVGYIVAHASAMVVITIPRNKITNKIN